MTYAAVLRRYMLAGLGAGILGAFYLQLIAEPVIKQGLKFESAYDASHAALIGPQGPQLYTRSQQLIGGMVAILFVALLLSFLFGTLYAFLRHRIVADLGDVKASTGLAGLVFVLTVLVPWFRYPFLPPGMGNGATVFKRSAWNLALIAVCIVAFVIVEWLVAKLNGRISNEARWTLAILAPVAVLLTIMALFPSVGDPYPYGLSVPMVWNFRLMALGNYALIWGMIGIGGGWMMRRLATATSPSFEQWQASTADQQRLPVSAAAS